MLTFLRRVVIMIFAFTIIFSVYATNNSAYADDIKGSSLEKEMREMIERGILSGYEDDTYRPKEKVTRGQFAAFISRALELPEGKTSFSDVPDAIKLSSVINKVKQAGIMEGNSNNTFKPNDYITREQVALTIQNLLTYKDMDLVEKRMNFTDQNDFVASSGVRAVFYAANYGIISGIPNPGTSTLRFDPAASATREQSAAMVLRFLNALEEVSVQPVEPGKPVEPVEPEKPVTPPDNTPAYQAAVIQNGKLVKTGAIYKDYLEAEKAFENQPSVKGLYNGDEIIRIKSGIAYSNNFTTNAKGQKVPEVTTLYDSYSGTQFRKQTSYIEHGREMRYIEANADAVKVQIGATIGWVKHSEVDFIPLELVTEREYYLKNQFGTLEHYVYNYMSKKRGSYAVGPAAEALQQGVKYYSYDGVHFSDAQGKLIATDYNYFQFLNVRSKTSYTAEEFDEHIRDVLAGREATNLPRYKDATKKSKMLDTGKFLIETEKKYNINALFILAAAFHESDYGTSGNAYGKNNLFGIRVYDSAPESGITFPTPGDSIESFARDYLNKNYIPPAGAYANGAVPGNKTSGFNVSYAADPTWGSKIAGHMFRIDIDLGKKDIHKEKRIITSYAGGINVRSEPDTSKSNVIFRYPARNIGYANDLGNPLVVIDEYEDAYGYTWYKVLSDLPSSKDGWIRGDLVNVMND